jgi:hypothetical protein
MKFLSTLIWLSWGAISARVALAPTLGLTFSQSLVLLLVFAPLVGLLCWLRWALRPRAEEGRATRLLTPEPTRASRARQAARGYNLDEWPGVVGRVF